MAGDTLPEWAEPFTGVETEGDLRVLEAELAAPNGNPTTEVVPGWAAVAGCTSVAEADALAEEIAEAAGLPSPKAAAAPPDAPLTPPVIEEDAPPAIPRLREVDELRLRVLSKKARRHAAGLGEPLTEGEAETLVRIAHEVTAQG